MASQGLHSEFGDKKKCVCNWHSQKNVRGTQDTAPQELTNSTVSAPPHKSIISGKSGVEVDGTSKQTLIKMGSSAAVTR